MPKTASRTAVLSATAAVGLTTALLLAAPHHGPETVVIDAAQDKRAAVTFPHEAHAEWVDSCDTCHHTQEGLTASSATEAEVRACATCHLDPEQEETPSMRAMGLKSNPFHAGCIDCHKEREKGPTQCEECHPKS
jgi:hypothetical protein